jgi:hypothetical protein
LVREDGRVAVRDIGKRSGVDEDGCTLRQGSATD